MVGALLPSVKSRARNRDLPHNVTMVAQEYCHKRFHLDVRSELY